MSIQPSDSPAEILKEAASRARNMAVAAAMIAFLLCKLAVERFVLPQFQALGRWLGRQLARFLLAAGEWLAPHWARLKDHAARTRVKVVRRTLEALIAVFTPLEALLARVAAGAKQRSAVLAERGTVSLAVVLRTTFNAIGALVRAGFSRPAVQALVQRLLELSSQAQK